MEATKDIFCVKGEDTVNHRRVTRWLKKFCSGYKSLEDQLKSGKPNTVDSEVVLQAIEKNLASSTRRVSGEHGIP